MEKEREKLDRKEYVPPQMSVLEVKSCVDLLAGSIGLQSFGDDDMELD